MSNRTIGILIPALAAIVAAALTGTFTYIVAASELRRKNDSLTLEIGRIKEVLQTCQSALGQCTQQQTELQRQVDAQKEELGARQRDLEGCTGSLSACSRQRTILISAVEQLNATRFVQSFNTNPGFDWSGYGDGSALLCSDGQYNMQCCVDRYFQTWYSVQDDLTDAGCTVRLLDRSPSVHHANCCPGG